MNPSFGWISMYHTSHVTCLKGEVSVVMCLFSSMSDQCYTSCTFDRDETGPILSLGSALSQRRQKRIYIKIHPQRLNESESNDPNQPFQLRSLGGMKQRMRQTTKSSSKQWVSKAVADMCTVVGGLSS